MDVSVCASAKFFDGKLVFLGANRYDRYSSKLKQRVEFGELPTTWTLASAGLIVTGCLLLIRR